MRLFGTLWTTALAGTLVGVPLLGTGSVRAQEAPLFESEAPLELTLIADFTQLERDRGDDPPERPATVRWLDDAAGPITVDAQLRTRGNFRRSRSNCLFPPLRLNLRRRSVEGTVFDGQDRLKIVGSCRPGREPFSQLVLREYLAYRAFGLVTETAFRVRLARITYEDLSGDMEAWTEWAFFVEDDDALAERLGGTAFELEDDQNLPAEVFEPVAATRLAVFAYQIGNTDWSEVQGHNVEIIETPSGAVAVPYDFDFSGWVDAPYASPDPSIGIRSVRERRYQGWCRPDGVAESVVGEFRAAADETLALIADFEALGADTRGDLEDYLSEFYESIETDERADRAFLRLCRRLPGR